jgi:hypothetical protein
MCAQNVTSVFELFTSPPRNVFSPTSSDSLSDLGLVPAAIINLWWILPTPPTLYLAESLLLHSDTKSSSTSSSSSSSYSEAGAGSGAFPTGQQLVAPTEAADYSQPKQKSAGTSGSSGSSSSSSNAAGSSKAQGKPKFFKL